MKNNKRILLSLQNSNNNPIVAKLYSTGCKACVTKNRGSRNPQAPTPPSRSLTAPVGTKKKEKRIYTTQAAKPVGKT